MQTYVVCRSVPPGLCSPPSVALFLYLQLPQLLLKGPLPKQEPNTIGESKIDCKTVHLTSALHPLCRKNTETHLLALLEESIDVHSLCTANPKSNVRNYALQH